MILAAIVFGVVALVAYQEHTRQAMADRARSEEQTANALLKQLDFAAAKMYLLNSAQSWQNAGDTQNEKRVRAEAESVNRSAKDFPGVMPTNARQGLFDDLIPNRQPSATRNKPFDPNTAKPFDPDAYLATKPRSKEEVQQRSDVFDQIVTPTPTPP